MLPSLLRRQLSNCRSSIEVRVDGFATKLAAAGLPLTANFRVLKSLQNKYVGSRAFIVGNGPSLRMDDLEIIKNEFSFAANKIYLAFDKTSWRPSFYLAEDPLAFNKSSVDLVVRESGLVFFPLHRKRQIIRSVRSRIIFYNLIGDNSWAGQNSESLPSFGASPVQGFYWGSTVTYSSIQMAAYMGFSEIFLIGVDCSYVAPEGVANGDRLLVSNGESNYFTSDYNPPGSKTYPPNTERHLRAYNRARIAAERGNFSIVNASRGGALEVFKRVNFDSLF